MMDIDQLIKSFQADLDESDMPVRDIVKKHITFGNPIVFDDDPSRYFKLKQVVASHFEIEPEEVIMCGSAKLGFSLNQTQLRKYLDDESDIDVVIISDKVFDKYWKELYEFNLKLTARTVKEEERYREFLDYFLKGWLRPDKFPLRYERTQSWFDFFKGISYKREFGGRKVTGAVYRERFFFESYHVDNIQRIRRERMFKK